MRRSILSIVLATITIVGLYSQEEPVLLTIAGEEVTLQEFERIYKKNNNETSLNKQTPEEYLDLFINFKLKVIEAESIGMDTTAKFINELEGYREQLAKPYLVDEETREDGMLIDIRDLRATNGGAEDLVRPGAGRVIGAFFAVGAGEGAEGRQHRIPE